MFEVATLLSFDVTGSLFPPNRGVDSVFMICGVPLFPHCDCHHPVCPSPPKELEGGLFVIIGFFRISSKSHIEKKLRICF